MSANIIDGKALSLKIRESLKAKISAKGIAPGLAVILVGSDPASQLYVNSKHKFATEVGIKSFQHLLPQNTSEEELLNLIKKLNDTEEVSGILVQLPLPKHINENKIIEAISPLKDVDGFHPLNVGNLVIGNPCLVPCTPFGCIELIKTVTPDLSGLKAVIIGRSNIVGKPMASLLLKENCTVEICHSRTKDLIKECQTADILVAAIGKAEMISGDYLKEGAIVIDVGINRTENGLKGDVEFSSASLKAKAITPVPGGVGPMTISMLLQNTLTAYQMQKERGLNV